MSEKITFRELIESIAEETNNSKQFTHDFIKDFVDVINGGLEEDGSVNIAGFGKFELRHMDERDGYNPQTEEKITIPAHNKVVFKPYKDLRELVNAPYAHLDSELMYDNTDEEVASEDTDAKEEEEFIPMAPPTSHEAVKESEDKNDTETDFEDPFGFDTENNQEFSSTITEQDVSKKEHSDEVTDEEAPFDFADEISEETSSSTETSKTEETEDDENGDIVEFNSNAEEESNEEEASSDISDFITTIEPSKSKDDTEILDEEPVEPFAEETEPEDAEVTDEEKTETSPYAPDVEDEVKDETESEDEVENGTESEEDVEEEINLEKLEEDNYKDQESEEETASASSFDSKRHSRKRPSKMPIFAAAAVILLLVAAGAWYFTSNTSTNNSVQIAASETSSTMDATTSQKDDQQAETAKADDQASSNTAKQNQRKLQSNTQKTSATTTKQTQVADNADLEIKEGQTLWSIAEDKYGNPRLWPWIYGNNGSLEDPDLILAGSSLSVPLPSGPQNTLNAADSIGVAKGFVSTYRWYKDNESMKARNHLWAATSYYDNIRKITDIEIDKADLVYANEAR